MAFEPVENRSIDLGSSGDVYTNLLTIANLCVELGWVLWDDRTSETDKFVVLKSDSSTVSDYEHECYVALKVFDNSHNWLRFYFFLYWNPDTHEGYGCRSWRTFTDDYTNSSSEVHPNSLRFLGSNINYLTIYGNKYFLNFRNEEVVDESFHAAHIFKLQNFPYDYNFKMMNTVSGSNNVVLELESGVDKIEVGDETFVLCKENHYFSKLVVNSVSTTSGTITVDSIFDTVAGSYIGSPTRIYPWCFFIEVSYDSARRCFNCYNYDLVADNYNATDPNYYQSVNSNFTWFPTKSTITDLCNVGKHNVVEDLVYYNDNSNFEIIGGNDYIKAGTGLEGEEFAYGKRTIGQATGGDISTIVDSSKSWTSDELAGKCVVVVGGKCHGDVRHIVSNTSNAFTVYKDFSANPDETTMYAIFDAFYRKCSIENFDYLLRLC